LDDGDSIPSRCRDVKFYHCLQTDCGIRPKGSAKIIRLHDGPNIRMCEIISQLLQTHSPVEEISMVESLQPDERKERLDITIWEVRPGFRALKTTFPALENFTMRDFG
jgi:hypothetical protein